MKQLFFYLLFLLVPFSRGVEAQVFQTYEGGPVHEAFVLPIKEDLTLRSIPVRPPESITERIPRQNDMQSEWIQGYWSWDWRMNEFVWVSGVWRRPPPGHEWVSGFWKQYDEGWVWVPGFWSRFPLKELTYISVSPPDSLDENLEAPLGSGHFWVPGFWYYVSDRRDFEWIPGHWEKLDPNWVLVPSHYVWRPGGYVFIPAYWDWTVGNRGTAFASVIIERSHRNRVVYEPTVVLGVDAIVHQLFLYYPDHLCVLYHHQYYYPQYWGGHCCTPPWWGWESWWTLRWHDHWALWWWYTHPGYLQPTWLTVEMSGNLPPPLSELLNLAHGVFPPAIITSHGMLSPNLLLRSIRKSSGKDIPVFPHDSKKVDRIHSHAIVRGRDQAQVLNPTGRRLPVDPSAVRTRVRRPAIDPDGLTRVRPLREGLRPKIPYKPRIPSHAVPIERRSQTPVEVGREVRYEQPVHKSVWRSRREVEIPRGGRSGWHRRSSRDHDSQGMTETFPRKEREEKNGEGRRSRDHQKDKSESSYQRRGDDDSRRRGDDDGGRDD